MALTNELVSLKPHLLPTPPKIEADIAPTFLADSFRRKLIVYLSSDNPGTGATTQKNNLAKLFDLFPLSGGWYRRAMAYHYQEMRLLKGGTAEQQMVWNHFARMYCLAMLDSPQALLALLEPHTTTSHSESTLIKLNQDQRQLGEGKKSAFLNMIPDLLLYYVLTQDTVHHGYILEAKWAVLNSLLIQEIRSKLRPDYPLPTVNPSLFAEARLLLKGKASTSAERVTLREIKNGTLPLPFGIQLDVFLDWFSSGKKKYPAGINHEEFDRWWHDLVEFQRQANFQRMDSDAKQMSMTYHLSGEPIHPAYIEKLSPKPLGVVDATQSELAVFHQLVKAVAVQVPEYTSAITTWLANHAQSA